MSNMKRKSTRVLVRVLVLLSFVTGVFSAHLRECSGPNSAAAAGGGSGEVAGSAGTKERAGWHPRRVSSEYIGVEVDMETGRLHIVEKQRESPEDLLFFDEPPSSYVAVYTNGDVFIYGDNTGEFIKRPMPVKGGIESIWKNDLLVVTARVELVKRADTGHEDGILVTYTVENRYEYAADVGLEVLFDTCLGEKRLQHFELPGGSTLEYETIFEKENLPEYWYSVDPETSPACLMGVLKGGLVTLPDKLIFANYRALLNERFGYKVSRKKRFNLLPYSRNDSAVALLFEPVSIEPGEMLTFTLLLGLCGPGEYVREAVAEGEKPLVRERPPEVEPVSPILIGPEVDLGRLNSKLLEINISKESVARINEYITRLNGLLGEDAAELGGEALTAEEMEALQRALSALGR